MTVMTNANGAPIKAAPTTPGGFTIPLGPAKWSNLARFSGSRFSARSISKEFGRMIKIAARAAHREPPMIGPLRLEIEFVIPRTASGVHENDKECRERLPYRGRLSAARMAMYVVTALDAIVYRNTYCVSQLVVTSLLGATGERAETTVRWSRHERADQ